MTGAQFCEWLVAMKAAGLARTDKAAAALLGRTPNTMIVFKNTGTDVAVALACTALLAGLAPYGFSHSESNGVRPDADNAAEV